MSGDVSRVGAQPAAVPVRQKLDFSDKELTPLDVLVGPVSDPLFASVPSTMGAMGMPGPIRTTIQSEITQAGRPDFKQTMSYEHKANLDVVQPAFGAPPSADPPQVAGTVHFEAGTHKEHVTGDGEYKLSFGVPGTIHVSGRGEHNHEVSTHNELVPGSGMFPDAKTVTQAGPFKLVFTTHMGLMQMEDTPVASPEAKEPAVAPQSLSLYPKTRMTTVYQGYVEDTRTGEQTPLQMELTAHMDPANPKAMHSELPGHFGDLPIQGKAHFEADGSSVMERQIGDYTLKQTMTQEYKQNPLMQGFPSETTASTSVH